MSTLEAHTLDKNNPHETQATQAGAATVEQFEELANDPVVTGETMELDQGTIAADEPTEQTTVTWNNAAVGFRGRVMRFVETARALTSRYFSILGGTAGAEDRFWIGPGDMGFEGADGANGLFDLGAHGGIPELRYTRRRGTRSAPTQLLSGDTLQRQRVRGRNSAGSDLVVGTWQFVAVEDYTGAAMGTRYILTLTKPGTLTLVEAIRLEAESAEFQGYLSGARRTNIGIKHAIAPLPATAGATLTAAGLIPVGGVVVGVTSVVGTALGASSGTTGYRVGDGADADRWGVAAGVAAGTKTTNANWTADTTPPIFLAAQDVVITADGGNFDGVGQIVVDVAYLTGGAA